MRQRSIRWVVPSTSDGVGPGSPHPLGSDAPTVDHVGLAVRSVGAAVATSSSWLAVVIWVALRMRGPELPVSVEEIDPNAPYLNLLLAGLVAALPVSGIVAWRLMAPISSNWRRGGLSMVGVLGGASLAMFTTYVAHLRAGPAGLLWLALLSAVLAFVLARMARSAAARAAAQS